MIIGLTGNIATGKSTVSKMFLEQFHIPVIDADVIAREIVEPGEQALKDIAESFGEHILLEDGTLNRKKLGNIIFKDSEKRKQLNEIVHPAIRKRMEEKKQALLHNQETNIVLDIPLLFENKLTYLVDKTVVVYTDEATQLQRLMKRNNLTVKEAKERMAAQMDLEEKKQLADAVIDNSGTLEESALQLANLLKKWKIF